MFWAAIEIITIFQNIRSMGQKKSFSTLLPPCSISWEPNSRWKLSRLSSIHWSRGRSKSYLKKISDYVSYFVQILHPISNYSSRTWKEFEMANKGILFHEIELQNFFWYYYEFWKTKRDDFFPVRRLVCVCIILVAFPSKFSKRDAIFDLELPMNFWQWHWRRANHISLLLQLKCYFYSE